MSKRITHLLAVLGVAALLIPAGAIAKGDGKPDSPGKSEQQSGKGKGRSKPKNHVVKGVVASVDPVAGTVVVSVQKGNKWGRSLVGQDVAFNLSAGRVLVGDVNGDGKADLNDVKAADKVLVQARLPRDKTGLTPPYAARKLIDLTSPPAKEADENDKS